MALSQQREQTRKKPEIIESMTAARCGGELVKKID